MMILIYSVWEAAYVLNESQQSLDFREVRRLHFLIVYWLSILHEMGNIFSPCNLDLLFDYFIILPCFIPFVLYFVRIRVCMYYLFISADCDIRRSWCK